MPEQGKSTGTPEPNKPDKSNRLRPGAKDIITIARTATCTANVTVRRSANAAFGTTICIAIVLMLLTGCGESSTVDTGVWSKAAEVAKSTDSLATSVSLYKWNQSLMLLGGDSGTFAVRVLEKDGKRWKTVSTVDPGWIPMDADPNGNRFVRSRATLLSESLDVRFTIGSLSPDGAFTSQTTAPLHLSQATLFGTAIPNLKMSQFNTTALLCS